MNTLTAAEAPASSAATEHPPAEHRFRSWDGTSLFYRAWLPGGNVAAERAIILLHRGHEHSGRWQEVAQALVPEDTAVFAWDARGHGQSPGERGDTEHVGVLAKDLDWFARHLADTHGVALENFALVAHSVGAVIAAAWVHDYAPPIRALVLATPAFRVKLYVPLAIPGLRLLQRAKPRANIQSYVTGKWLTHDPVQARAYDADTAISKQISVRVLLDLHDTATRLVADAGAIVTPTLLLAAGSDRVVKTTPQRAFFDRLSSTKREFEILAGFSHAIFHETGRRRVIERVRRFIDEAFATPSSAESALLAADEAGHTKTEYDRLRAPLPALSPRGLNFATQRAGMNTLCRLSRGVTLGWATGFDSGQSLDYIYENQARGTSLIGRLIDRQYLDAIGWRGIRQRKVHLQKLLAHAIAETRAAGRPVRLLDIAAGPGRYLLEVVRDLRRADASAPITALLRDRNLGGLNAGKALAREMGLDDAVTYAAGDAFDEDDLAAISPHPTVAVVSGLYELFPQNGPVRASLRGLHAALAADGFLIYTNQPWHPQVEMIARVLPNRDGQPWVMRRRTQAEMDALVRATGFEKLATEIDRWGIFTVSLARKTDSTRS